MGEDTPKPAGQLQGFGVVLRQPGLFQPVLGGAAGGAMGQMCD